MACASKKKHYPNRRRAEAALERVQDNPSEPEGLLPRTIPSGIIQCSCGDWVLTSKAGKVWAAGKGGNDVRRRRR